MKRQFIQPAVKTKTKQPLSATIKKRTTPKIVIKQQAGTPDYSNSDGPAERIAIIQPGSWGDNINSTLMLKPLKAHWPDSVIDVYTSTLYAGAFHNNPHITNIVKYKAEQKNEALHLVHVIPTDLKGKGYTRIFNPHPMINPDKWTSLKSNAGTNIICAWIRALEDLDIPYKMPLQTILRLTKEEIQNVNNWLRQVDNMNNHRNILMEVHGESGQSFWNDNWTMRVCKHLLNGKTHLFISRRHNGSDIKELQGHAPGKVHFVGHFSIRECAELFNKCQCFFSISSGLSNACNTNWCKDEITWIETINSEAVSSAPIRKEGKTFWYENDLDKFIGMLKEQGI